MTTTMRLSGPQSGHATSGAGRRRPPRRPLFDLGPWIAPVAWMAVLAIFVAGVGAIALLRDGVPSGAATTIAIRVSPSDTLWSIAKANRLPGASTAATVEAIERANGLTASSLRPGTVLRVPAVVPAGSDLAQAGPGTIAR
jgi:hypothetical protein